VAWIDGGLCPVDEATVAWTDHGVVVGDGAFEALQIVRGMPFAATRHIRRLRGTLEALAIPAPDDELLLSAMRAVIAANAMATGKLRVTVTAGSGPLGSGEPTGPPHAFVAAAGLDRRPPAVAVTVPWSRNERGALAGLKTTSYAENVRALRYAHERGAGEALFANTRGELCEGTGTNVFVVIDGLPRTPPLSSGCLAGVTRALVLEMTDAVEERLPVDALLAADEVFLTSSLRNVQPMERVDARALGAAPVAEAVAARFDSLLASDDLDP
jgi:branched-chain amino acid aminotransferase